MIMKTKKLPHLVSQKRVYRICRQLAITCKTPAGMNWLKLLEIPFPWESGSTSSIVLCATSEALPSVVLQLACAS